ncbi:MAG: mechanosensitive ion channel family protein [Anaerolineaceae bacterium]|jgi:small-conductance mechanosensitive channel|nr:mechanosensitive ion channel family protein [Anaerolineaceae bacterium]
MSNFFIQIPWMDEIIRILIYFASAWVVAFFLKRLVRRAIRLGRLVPRSRKPSHQRQQTLQSLVSSAINLIVFIIATLASLGLFIQPDTLAWMVGLFSAAFGLGARPLISDYLAGLSFIFEDTFAVGEKIEIYGPPVIEGVVEAINLRTTMLRSPTGEMYVTPNGEIRTVRNFSRGKFSIANVTIKISASDLGSTITILEALGEEAVVLLPNLIEPWQVISPKGVIGQFTELTVVAKARFGKAAVMRPLLLNLVQERLLEAGIALTA